MRWLIALLLLAAPGVRAAGEVVVYSGRSPALIRPLLEQFEKQTGVKVKVRYGETPGLAALILEEGKRSPADVFLAQDAGALGLLERQGRLAKLPGSLTGKVAPPYRSDKGSWVGLSGRLRVLAYNTAKVEQGALPDSVDGLTAPRWKGKVGWAPTNASFQAFVTAYRLSRGEQPARAWLRAMAANRPRVYKNNTAIIEALARGEIEVGLVNHYYLHAMAQDRKAKLPVANHYLSPSDPGALMNVAGAGILDTAKHPEQAHRLLTFLLDAPAQRHFSTETFEYPLAAEEVRDARLPPLGKGGPTFDLSGLDELRGTLTLLQDEGIL